MAVFEIFFLSECYANLHSSFLAVVHRKWLRMPLILGFCFVSLGFMVLGEHHGFCCLKSLLGAMSVCILIVLWRCIENGYGWR